MRQRFSCFSQRSVLVSSASCTSSSTNGFIAPTTSVSPSIRNVVTSLYRIVLSTQKQLLITVTWLHQELHISFADGECTAVFKLDMGSRLSRKKKGRRSVEADSYVVEVFWDFSAVRDDATGPEPIDGFYVVVVVDSEIALILGDMSEEDAARKFINVAAESGVVCSPAGGRCSLISRQEHCYGNAVYATRAQFSEGGPVHDILIRCTVGEIQHGKKSPPALLVSVDKRVVMRMKRLQWNFRGNQTTFIDGLLVDVMWDLHGWFSNPARGHPAVFMLRTRNKLDSRLWLEEKSTQKEQDKVDFSLVIYGYASKYRAS